MVRRSSTRGACSSSNNCRWQARTRSTRNGFGVGLPTTVTHEVCNKIATPCFSDEIFGRAKLPSLAKEGWLRPSTKCREASLAGADGVVGSSHRLSVVEQTTPAAPSKERGHSLDGASTPPWPRRGVCFAQKSRQ